MQKEKKNDLQKLLRIAKSISNILKCFEQLSICNANDLKNEVIAQAACTQFITNIYESKKNLMTKHITDLSC